jgi:hypothetical protein
MTGTPPRERPPRRRPEPFRTGLLIERTIAGDHQAGIRQPLGQPAQAEDQFDARRISAPSVNSAKPVQPAAPAPGVRRARMPEASSTSPAHRASAVSSWAAAASSALFCGP